MRVSGVLMVSAVTFAVTAAACGGARAGSSVALIDGVHPDSMAPLPRAEFARSWNELDSTTAYVPMLIATTRRAVDAERPGFRYGTRDANELSFGFAQVSVPSYRLRKQGALPRAGSGAETDPSRETVMTSLRSADSARFVRNLAEDLSRTRSRDVLVFIHGYNSSFEDGAVRAAQIVADMGFDGSVVYFSWPSAGELTGYIRDQQTARNTGFYLLKLLREIIPQAQPDRIHVLAHSMGSEVLSKAISLIDRADTLPRLAQVAFAAPDVDARIFGREILPTLREHSNSVTLYASSEDDALRASRVLNNVWRLGLGGDSLTVLDGMTTIDATRVRGDLLGHTLFGNPSLLSDLFDLLAHARTPEERRLLRVIAPNGAVFYRFR